MVVRNEWGKKKFNAASCIKKKTQKICAGEVPRQISARPEAPSGRKKRIGRSFFNI